MRLSIAIRIIATAAVLFATFGAQAGPHIVVDVQSGTVLSHEDAFKRWYQASITKLMTIYVVLDAVEKGEESALPMANGSAAAVTGPVSVDALGEAGEDWHTVFARADAARRAACPWS